MSNVSGGTDMINNSHNLNHLTAYTCQNPSGLDGQIRVVRAMEILQQISVWREVGLLTKPEIQMLFGHEAGKVQAFYNFFDNPSSQHWAEDAKKPGIRILQLLQSLTPDNYALHQGILRNCESQNPKMFAAEIEPLIKSITNETTCRVTFVE